MKFQTHGLIIKEQNIGEQDKAVTILTGSHGVLRAFVRGGKSLKSGKAAPTSLLSYSRLTLYKGRESYSVGDAQTEKIFSRLRSDVRKMCLAQYFCELALTICPREQPAEAYLRLMLNSLYLISEDKRPELLVKACLEMRMAAMAGYLPDLVMCRGCGKYTDSVMYFLPGTGELKCPDCRESGDGAVELSGSALTALRHTVYADDDKLFSFSLGAEGLQALNQASEAYLCCRFEKDFQTLIFYKTIS